MLTLSLFRHAKSSWEHGGLADYDRPLAKRGQKAAPQIAAELTFLGVHPGLILCSGAARTRETLALALPKLDGAPPEVVYDDEIYMATPAALLSRLRKIPAGSAQPNSVMIVGHNPGLEELAALLVGGGDDEPRSRMAAKFPAGAVAVISFAAPSWAGVGPGAGTLEHFITPKRLT